MTDSAKNRWGIACATCGHRYTWTGPLSPVPPCPQCVKAKDAQPAQPDASEDDDGDLPEEVVEALDLVDSIENLAGDLPEEGRDFGESVTEKANDIAENIRRHRRVTDKQLGALENMLGGLERWFDH
jgi:hypothetical protein